MEAQAHSEPRGIRSLQSSGSIELSPLKDATGLPVMEVSTFEARIAEWVGKYREQMLAEGYASTEAWMNDVRGR